jgi:hypothetical protein
VSTPTSVYRYYDSDGTLIYVGITGRGVQRQREHNERAEWWPFVRRQDVEHFDNRPEAAARERDLIGRHCPPFNRQHNPLYTQKREDYLALRASQSRGCKCGPNCEYASDEHHRGWGLGWEYAMQAYPSMYRHHLARLIASAEDDPELADLARHFMLAGSLLALRLQDREAVTATEGPSALTQEILPQQAEIDEYSRELAATGAA